MNESETKTCRECGKTKNHSEFSLVSKTTGTRRNICKSCNSNDSKDYQKANRNSNKKVSKSGKRKCSRCSKVKKKTEFNKDSSTNSGLRAVCKSCQSITFKVYSSKADK
jgi:protein-arginine kinase activator protein McsA